ncbi:AmiS/UreI family transporter [Roseovarius sp. M141]|uniref:AmiS/UreI family transporter n=1 Tax=Roseovarius sp. M141 TaxID=2583806 RepID=UPI0020CE03E2|nr:AmiS/UreI family transporter [Roseovarius sp. M141]MCQ0093444.1 hypothetical protein [Roseovarius sp. M141]
MLTGLVLLCVGAVPFLNGLWLTDRIADRETVVINLIVAAISARVAAVTALGAGDVEDVRAGAMMLLARICTGWPPGLALLYGAG